MTSHRTALPFWLIWLLQLSAANAQTLPAGGAFTAGTGAIAAAGQTMTITQTSPRGIVAWPGFSIAPGGAVIFDNGDGATLNRVTGTAPSSLAGSLTATGSVYLINPNGIVIAPTGKILTAGTFAASTRDVPDAAFMAGGTLAFGGASPGAIANAGEITSQSGNVMLIGADAANRGAITAPNGTAALAAANRVILAPAGTPGLYVAPDAIATGTAENTGTIRAAAASLAAAGGNVFGLAGNQSGLIQATATGQIGGQVWLTALDGNVTVSGAVRATGPGGAGGTIIADGRTVTLTGTAALTAAGKTGGMILSGISAAGEARQTTIASGASLNAGSAGTIETSGLTLNLGDAAIIAGNWKLDPENLIIGPPAAASIDAALDAGSNVTEETTAAPGAGNITVAAPLSWSSDARLTLSAFGNLDIAARVTITGDGGLALTTGNDLGGQSPATAALSFAGGGAISYTAGADTNAAPLTINAAPYNLIFNPTQLQAVGRNGEYALAQNLDLAGIQFTPVAQQGFSGILNGLGNVITNLTIDDTTVNNVGLFGAISLGGVVENLGLVGGATIGGGGLFSAIGALAGINQGILRNDFATGPVSGTNPHAIGGLAGANSGLIGQSYATGAVTATGAGTGAAGGLVGATEPGGLLQDVYATGAVTGAPYSEDGGLAGLNFETTIEDAFATGAVTGGNTGGLIANNQSGSYLDAYFDTTTTGAPAGPGTGLTTAQWFTAGPLVAGSPNGFVNPAAWRQGSPYPVLAALPYVTVTETGAQTYGGDDSASVLGITDEAGQNAASQVNTSNFSTLTGAGPTTNIGTFGLGGTGDVDPGVQIDYTGSLTIAPAPLTITADNQTATYGQPETLGNLDISATGLLNQDRITAVTLSTDAGAGSPVGTYSIAASGAAGLGLTNYIIRYRPGTLTIDPARLLITADDIFDIYGQAPAVAGQFTAAGLVNGDTVQNLTLTTAATAFSPASAVFALTPSAAGGQNLANYLISYAPGTLTVIPAPLTITADSQIKQAGQFLDLGETAFTVTGLADGNTVATVTLTSLGAAADAT